MAEIVITLILLVIGLTCGTYTEKRHYESIRKREKDFLKLPALTTGLKAEKNAISNSALVVGTVAISIDYFKTFTGALRNFFGGRVGAYESLIDRARREATLRMKAQAVGFDAIINTRIETSPIGGESSGSKGVISIEAIAYGTAVKYANNFK